MYIDLRKAFDCVDHVKLIQKCEGYGIKGKVLQFIRAFLTNRWQRVKVGSSFSTWTRVTSGVPQGSVLGPLLFLIYINDMPDILQACRIKLYADDAKIYCAKLRQNPNAQGMQRDITSLQLWCDQWQMQINGSKCSLLQVGWNRPNQTQYLLSGTFPPVETCQDLGVLISGPLTFAKQCSSVTVNASRRVGLIYRAFSSRDVNFMCGMYVTYIRSILEYNCEIQSPLYIQDIDRIESIQRKFTKRINGLFHRTYKQRQIFCGFESLELRRIKRDVILVYKIVHNIVDLRFDDYFAYAPNVGTRGNSLKLYPFFAGRNVAFNFFGNRVVNYWNSLPDYVVTAASLNIFKNRLDEKVHLLHRFLRGRAFKNL